MKKALSLIALAVLFTAGILLQIQIPEGWLGQGAFSFLSQNPADANPTYTASTTVVETPVVSPRTATLFMVGDIMLDRAVRGAVERRGGDYQFLFNNIVLPKADITFGNLEGAAARSGANQGSIYSFRMNPDSLLTLAQNNFNVLSIANNHIGDWGATAANETAENIYAAQMQSTGWSYATTSDALVIVERNNIRFGFLAFSEFNSGGAATETRKGILLATAPYYEPMIRQAAQQVDVLIVSLHAGTEYAPYQNAFQERIAKQAIDAGAHIVVGHHPHVVQPVVEYNNSIIAYSLGNFIFDQSFSSETTQGGALLINVDKDKNTLSYRFGKTKQDGAFALLPIEWEEAERVISF
jgi:poly-gamma-glutamate synthesis protein (capsule biosynthesis protein)